MTHDNTTAAQWSWDFVRRTTFVGWSWHSGWTRRERARSQIAARPRQTDVSRCSHAERNGSKPS